MEPDDDKIDAAVLALLYLTLHDDRRAWKGFPWEATDRLYERGLISNPRTKAKSVVLSDDGMAEAEKMFRALLAKPEKD
ncbi:hypothetical protein S4A8_10151 [Salinisphaera sp. S4-8]|uniref:DUF6429 family protein n=1 Tax=Salinisphaera sp. S4-8 TaxID=633357 RepID=UPI00333EBE77